MNKNILKGTNSKVLLIGKIKGLAEESKHTRQLLLKNKHKTFNGAPLSNMYAITKNIIGADIRHHLLAYAFMRGDVYSKLERKCRPGGQPNVDVILQIVHTHLPSPTLSKGWLLENIQTWIKEEK